MWGVDHVSGDNPARRGPLPPSIEERVGPLVERLWRYHHMDHQLIAAEAILVLCSHDTIVAERGARLFLDGWAPLLIFSGGLGAITKGLWADPEADRFARIARAMGVPDSAMLIENRSTNTGENVQFTREMLAARGLDPASFILVQKPYMERRTFATFSKVWPGKQFVVTSPQISLDDYLSAVLQRRVVSRRRHRHHGGRSSAHPRIPGARVPDSSTDSGGRVGCVFGTGAGGVRQVLIEERLETGNVSGMLYGRLRGGM